MEEIDFTAPRGLDKTRMLRLADGGFMERRENLMILDDFGMQNLDATTRMNLMEIIEDRHGRKSTIIASQLPVASWYEVIGESTVADAILDRLIHGAHRIELKGSSPRKKDKHWFHTPALCLSKTNSGEWGNPWWSVWLGMVVSIVGIINSRWIGTIHSFQKVVASKLDISFVTKL
jgi:hypothetical protein